MKKHINIYTLFIILPFIDVITSIVTRHSNFILTPGLVLKSVFLILSVIYIFKIKSKHKRFSKIFCMILIIYSFLYFISKPECFTLQFIVQETVYLFKLFYFPIIFLGLICYFDINKFNKEKMLNVLLSSLFIYIILLAIPNIFGTANATYFYGLKGTIGWFYAGNEISNITIMLFASLFYLIEDKKNILLFSLLPILYVIFNIGTKVSYLGLIITSLILLIFGTIKNINKDKTKFLKYLIVFVITIMFSTKSVTIQNNKFLFENQISEEEINNPINIEEKHLKEISEINDKITMFYNKNKFNLIFKKLLNSRDLYLANTLSIYNNDKSNSKILYGIGYSNTKDVNNANIAKLIEIDIFDVFFHNGIFGLLITLLPFIYTLHYVLSKRHMITLSSIYYILIILMVFSISTFSGHTLTSPSVSIYVILYLLLLLNEFQIFNNNKSIKQKISILSLHLGYGGIERSIVNQANMLCDSYDVEIISLYKVLDSIPYTIDNRVKVIYLSNLKPNKAEFLKCYKNKNIIKVIKEGFKSVYILYKKQTLIEKYISNSDSKIIISTRLESTRILNKFRNNSIIKIAEEHCHHNDNIKYIKKLKKSLTNIDYLIPASQYLTNDYQKFFNNENVVIKYIPNVVSEFPDQLNKCDNYNVISVGRFSPEKGYRDLVDIYKNVTKINSKIRLIIAGDGSDMEEIKEINETEKLNINLTGFLNHEELKNVYTKASLFVMTSHEESFGIVLIEAMSYGIPCFAFDSALGAKEIINNKNGTLIKDRNKNLMAKEILNYFKSNPNNDMINAARAKSTEYSFNEVKPMWINFIDDILNKEFK